MPFKIVRNDITKMNTEAIVNTANVYPTVGTGCDSAIYKAAGYEELLNYRREHTIFRSSTESRKNIKEIYRIRRCMRI